MHKAKTQCESLDYIFQLAVEMHKLGLPWTRSQARKSWLTRLGDWLPRPSIY
ncbi:MAG: hypothetical protein INR71_05555 [Terriglobus roseus]|nr:hypothetical protein [Terriglobus roseus]